MSAVQTQAFYEGSRLQESCLPLQQFPGEAQALKGMVARQMNRSGNALLCGLEPLLEEEFYASSPHGISAAWTVGHLACVSDLFSSWFGGNRLLLDASLHSVFNSLEIAAPSGMTKAETVDPKRYPKGQLFLLLRQAQVKALEVLDGFDAERWNAPVPRGVPDTLMTCGAVWEHLAVHTYWHLGELTASLPRFHGTYTLNTVPHYFYTPVRRGH
jgi:hypothetical protein